MHTSEPITIEQLIYEGYGLARSKTGDTYLVARAYPEDELTPAIQKKKRGTIFATIDQITKPSPHRVTPPCPHVDHCGGCPWQELAYEQQLYWKHQIVQESLSRIGGIHTTVHPVLPSPTPFGFRNKVEFSFFLNQDGYNDLGFHDSQNPRDVIPLTTCLLIPPPMQHTLKVLRDFFRKYKFSVFSRHTGKGTLKSIIIRYSHSEDKILICLLTGNQQFTAFSDLANILREETGNKLSGILWFEEVQRKGQPTTKNLVEQAGEEALHETINGVIYRIPTFVFFQTNALQAPHLAETVLQAAAPQEHHTLLDVYCGNGFFALQCAKQCKSVTGIELEPSLIAAAQANAQTSGITNFMGIVGKARAVLKELVLQRERYTTCIVDPPRAGLSPKVVSRLAALRPQSIIYVSCNPATFARDCALFTEESYQLKEVFPVDMFPHSYHCEVVGILKQ